MRRWVKANKGFLVFLLCFGIFRTAIADWNPIPSGSMRPTLLEGDVVFVNRLAYDVKVPLTDIVLTHTGEPRRGDVVTFSSPQDGTRLIKRLVAVPGDVVEMRNEVLFINGEAARYDAAEAVQETIAPDRSVGGTRLTEQLQGHERRVQWLHGVSALSSFDAVVVPEGEYLMLGDNRDNSADSRYFGLVPRHLLIGRALGVLVSADINSHWMPRLERFGQRL
ncbi:signal peptidase I [Paenacidovorax monticola]|uniref:Signal peptidase I n=1 Tax=Paenacidovorax monticola TaxID=1926868 RepID=A0A7H0HJ44_9BURK|nr:signal peptidase I [Paenacidovorax monticola]QNP60560.1 signal peptidase I [Paenacidovorax monticola]